MPLVFFDLETSPGPTPPDPSTVQADKRLTDPAKIEADKAKKADELHRAQSLHALQGRIITIGWAIEDDEPKALQVGRDCNDEQSLIGMFEFALQGLGYHQHESWTWVGHNAKSFDAHWLWLRAKKYGHRWLASRLQIDRFRGNVEDTLVMAATGDTYGHRYSLDMLTEFFTGQKAKKLMDGSQVWDAFKAGEYDKIAAYCMADVINTRNLYHALT